MFNRVVDEHINKLNANISMIVKDLTNNKILYCKDADRIVPSASTIKLVIMTEAFRQIMEGKLNYSTKVRVRPEDKVDFSLFTNMITDEYCLIDVITLMMTISDNTATNVLIDLLGYENINRLAASLGLRNTMLRRKMMDFEAARQGRQNLTSPADLALLMEKIYRHEILNDELCHEMIRIMSINTIKEMMSKFIPNEVVLAHKTGELDNLNHDIGILFMENIHLLIGIFITEVKDNITGRQYIEETTRLIYEYMKEKGYAKV